MTRAGWVRTGWVVGFALGLCLLGGPARGQCRGDASASTSSSSKSCGSLASESTLTWQFQLLCIDECNQIYHTTSAEQATAIGQCVTLPLPGGVSECPPQFNQFNHTNGLWGTTNAFDRILFGGQCHNDSLNVTEATCPCAPSCDDASDEPDIRGDTPILISLTDGGLRLTSAGDGVSFDLDSDGVAQRIGWTHADAEDGFLVLDRNANGLVDDGRELFGNHTPQLPSAERNGFRALAVFDDPLSGGNGDGWIDARDGIYSHLRLWIDRSHDGISDAGELQTLREAGIEGLELEYRTSQRRDQHGNVFRYHARVTRSGGPGGALAWDVFLVAAP